MSAATQLYTPAVLALATELDRFHITGDCRLVGEARSPTCGSMIRVGLMCDADGQIERVEVSSTACAIGQATAALFARSAVGHDAVSIGTTLDAIDQWLAGKACLPEWPGIELIAAACGYPARHGAIRLPWMAAIKALHGERRPA